MRYFSAHLLVAATVMSAVAQENPIPPPVTTARFVELIERPPFRRHLSLSDALVLSGVARLPNGAMVTVWNRTTGESFIVTPTPNPQGWRLVSLSESTDLKSMTATIAAGDQQIALRFDPERLTPPKLDNQSKPARRNEGSLVIEALLRTLDPVGAKAFETLSVEAQEKFRKSFSEFLASYPSSSDEKRISFIQRSLSKALGPEKKETAVKPDDPAGLEKQSPAPASDEPSPEAEPGSDAEPAPQN
ncbi:MAG: hypothetical protein ACR2OZ_17955 [Verrucomicrobiales bacterium]